MNAAYEALLQGFSVQRAIVDCAMGRLRLPVAGTTYPAPWYGYPPALIPMWSEGDNYIGIWRHWFTPRPLSFVKVYVRAGYRIVEIARTDSQLFCYATISAIVVHDGVRPETEEFALKAGIENLTEIDSATIRTGDSPRGFAAICQFQTDTPLASADEAQYDGWFPRSCLSAAIPWWHHCCSLEIDDVVRGAWPPTVPVPLYISACPTPQMFQDFLQAGDFGSAWLTLNSAGWSLPDARQAIVQLADASGDSMFATLTAAWLTASEGQYGGY